MLRLAIAILLSANITLAQSWLSCVETLALSAVNTMTPNQMKSDRDREFTFTFRLDSKAVPKFEPDLKITELSLAHMLAVGVVLGQTYRRGCAGRRFSLKVRVIRKEWDAPFGNFSKVNSDDSVDLVVFTQHPSVVQYH
ncbi:MAG: hypothetical protein NTV52_10495 [Acidobacteria bacterium]|nr:hypothetical protein [Acidobacteriota bacterium]